MSEKTPKVVFPLRLKIAAMACFLAAIPPSVVGFRLIDVNRHTVESLSREVQLAVIADISHTINREFSGCEEGLITVGRTLTNRQIAPEGRIAGALSLVEANEFLDHAAIYDRYGELIDVIREEESPQFPMPEQLGETLRRAIENHNVSTGDPLLIDEEIRVQIVLPLRAEGRVTGFIASFISLALIQRKVEDLSETRFPNERDSLFVVDRNLKIVAHPERQHVLERRSVARQGIFETNEELLIRGDLARSGEYLDPSGRPMLGSATSIPGRSLVVVAQIPQSVAYESLTEMRTMTIETLAIAVVCALLIGLVLSRRISSPLTKLTEFAQNLAARKWNTSIKVKTRDELSVLAHTLGQAATDLEKSEEDLKKEQAIRTDLKRYLPNELVDQIVQQGGGVTLGGERREVTILFADVVSFTPLTEKNSPEQIVTILNELFTILTGIVFKHGGTVDKFIGDCVMAFWGAPNPQDDHADRAVAAAEDMMRWLETGNETWQERFDVTIRLAIGIHTGEVIVGNIGSERRMDYTVIGDVVNTAARLEAVARPQQILVTEATQQKTKEDFEYIDAGSHRLAGKRDEVQLFEVQI